MNATPLASSNVARKTTETPTRPVKAMLLELAYHLHATHVVEVLPVQPKHRPVRRTAAQRIIAARSA